MNGAERIAAQVRKCETMSRRNMEWYGRTGNKVYLRKAKGYYKCAAQMEEILRRAGIAAKREENEQKKP